MLAAKVAMSPSLGVVWLQARGTSLPMGITAEPTTSAALPRPRPARNLRRDGPVSKMSSRLSSVNVRMAARCWSSLSATIRRSSLSLISTHQPPDTPDSNTEAASGGIPAGSGHDFDRARHVLVDAADVAVGPRLGVGDGEGVALGHVLALRGRQRARVFDVMDRRVPVGPGDLGPRLHDDLLRLELEVDDADGRLPRQRDGALRRRRRRLGPLVSLVVLATARQSEDSDQRDQQQSD